MDEWSGNDEKKVKRGRLALEQLFGAIWWASTRWQPKWSADCVEETLNILKNNEMTLNGDYGRWWWDLQVFTEAFWGDSTREKVSTGCFSWYEAKAEAHWSSILRLKLVPSVLFRYLYISNELISPVRNLGPRSFPTKPETWIFQTRHYLVMTHSQTTNEQRLAGDSSVHDSI